MAQSLSTVLSIKRLCLIYCDSKKTIQFSSTTPSLRKPSDWRPFMNLGLHSREILPCKVTPANFESYCVTGPYNEQVVMSFNICPTLPWASISCNDSWGKALLDTWSETRRQSCVTEGAYLLCSCPSEGTSSVCTPGTGCGGPCPLCTFLFPLDTCKQPDIIHL